MRRSPDRIDGGVGGSGVNMQQRPDFYDPERIRQTIAEVKADAGMWLTPAYSLALQAEHLLSVLDGSAALYRREVRHQWTREEDELVERLGIERRRITARRSHLKAKMNGNHANAD